MDMASHRLSRIRGCLLGALAGDCLGKPFEGNSNWQQEEEEKALKHRKVVIDFVTEKMHRANPPAQKLTYTDDTAMAHAVLRSLISCKGFNARNMATEFVNTFYADVSRGYGRNVCTVFEKLRSPQLFDVYQPAKEQFNGMGSRGNGGAMRVAPVALFYANQPRLALKVAEDQCRLTHSHPEAVLGSVLLTAAVVHVFNATKLTEHSYIDHLMEVLRQHHGHLYPQISVQQNPYFSKLSNFPQLLGGRVAPLHVASILGNQISAVDSVPAALYAFIHCLAPSEDEFKMENPIARTLAYAISLGGDTDTIGTMAGAIAGAYYGDTAFPKTLIENLEGSEFCLDAASDLSHRLSSPK